MLFALSQFSELKSVHIVDLKGLFLSVVIDILLVFNLI